LQGGCLCGAIRYRVEAEPIDAGYCHCRICRRSTGAPAVAWGTVRVKGFAFLSGTPVAYPSSPRARRQFCGACGTQLTFQYTQKPETIDFTLGSLDDPEALPPQYHIWTQSRIGWFDTSDPLPRHPDGGPDARA
jgi:hypothetical protein